MPKNYDSFIPTFDPSRPFYPAYDPTDKKQTHPYYDPIFQKLSSLRGLTGDSTPYNINEFNSDIENIKRMQAIIDDAKRNIEDAEKIKDPKLLSLVDMYRNRIDSYTPEIQKLKNYWENPFTKAVYGGSAIEEPVSIRPDGTKVYKDGTILSPGQWKRTNADGTPIASNYDLASTFNKDLAGTGYEPQPISDFKEAIGYLQPIEWMNKNPGKSYSDYQAYLAGPSPKPHNVSQGVPISASVGGLQNPLAPTTTPKIQMPSTVTPQVNKSPAVNTANLTQAYQNQNQAVSNPAIQLPQQFQQNFNATPSITPPAGMQGVRMPKFNRNAGFNTNWSDLFSVAHNRYTR